MEHSTLSTNSNNGKHFQYVFSNQQLYNLVTKIIQKPFFMKNAKQELLWKELEANILYKYKNRFDKGETIHDTYIYNELHLFMNTRYYPICGEPNNESPGRSLSRVLDIQKILKHTGNPYIYKYVDIGCSEGGITSQLGKQLGCGDENIFGVDIIPPERAIHKHAFKYIQINEDENQLPFGENSVCLVTALMSLHHIKYAEKYIQEIYRILRPGSFFIMQEHDVSQIQQRISLDILHGMYSMVWCLEGRQENPLFCDNYYGEYKSRAEWRALMHKHGFILCELPHGMIFKSIPRKNMHSNFWDVFIKPNI
jgi:SAM-dependent methyltransferase